MKKPEIPRVVPPFQNWSYEEVAQRANDVIALFARNGIPLHRDSTLNKLLKNMGAFATDWKTGRHDKHSTRRVVEAGYVHRITSAILEVRDDPSAINCLARIAGKRFDLGDREASQGEDALWELEMLSRLRKQGANAELAEPDIVADFGFGEYAIACKKSYSASGVGNQVRKGANQISASNKTGLVALNIDDLFPKRDLPIFRSGAALLQDARTFVSSFIEANRHAMGRFVFEGKCDAVLVSLSTAAHVEDSTARFINVHFATIWTLNETDIAVKQRIDQVRKSFARLLT